MKNDTDAGLHQPGSFSDDQSGKIAAVDDAEAARRLQGRARDITVKI
jgi:hypothetical protein